MDAERGANFSFSFHSTQRIREESALHTHIHTTIERSLMRCLWVDTAAGLLFLHYNWQHLRARDHNIYTETGGTCWRVRRLLARYPQCVRL